MTTKITVSKPLVVPPPMHYEQGELAKRYFKDANFLVVKLTDYCNLSCTYCHQDALIGKPAIMPIETVKNAIRLMFGSSNVPVVWIQFHGGEPLLAPEEYFRELVEFAKSELKTTKKEVRFAIQTNLTLVNSKREKMLNDLGMKISYSLDGPPQLNDEMRGGGKLILENWRRMKNNNTQAGTICLIQPSNADKIPEVLEFFAAEGIHRVRFNLMVPDGRGTEIDPTTTEKLFTAKKTILDFMLATEGNSVNDLTLVRAMERMMKMTGAPSTFGYYGCESLYCQAGRSLFSLNPDGRFYACDRIAESPRWALGNVNTVFEQEEHDTAVAMRGAFHHKDDWWARCEGCDAKKICEFSCSAYYVDKVDTRETECTYTKKMWKYFLERKEDISNYFLKTSIQPEQDITDPDSVAKKQKVKIIQEIAKNALYSDISSVERLASNKHYQLFKRGESFFLYLNKREKIFEVDGIVADIAKFNGCLSIDLIASILNEKYQKHKLSEILDQLSQIAPEIFLQGQDLSKTQVSSSEMVSN